MNTHAAHIDRIRQKMQTVLKEYQALEKENEKLRSEMSRKLALEQELKGKVAELEQQVSLVKATSGQMDEASKKAFEKQLNHYIREIDRCIAMLSQ